MATRRELLARLVGCAAVPAAVLVGEAPAAAAPPWTVTLSRDEARELLAFLAELAQAPQGQSGDMVALAQVMKTISHQLKPMSLDDELQIRAARVTYRRTLAQACK